MKLSKEKILRQTERFLKRTEEYQDGREIDKSLNYQIQYILSKEGNMQPEMIIAHAYSGYQDMEIYFYPFCKEKSVYYNWSLDFEEDLFEPLEKGYEIVLMSSLCHSVIWRLIEDSYNNNCEYGKGMQTYLSYCKRNGITKQFLQENGTYDGMDVMSLYKKARETKKVQER